MYSDLFDLYVEYADSISAVVLWGVTDDQSWRASRLPLLFDATYQAKPAYYSIIDNIDTSTITTSATTATTTTTTTTTTATTPQVTDIPFSTVPGDLDGDEVVALTDLVLLQKYLLQRQSLTAEQGEVADYNGDGNINVIDLILLKRYIIVNR
jgi:endo-1,4-beta-xylanase